MFCESKKKNREREQKLSEIKEPASVAVERNELMVSTALDACRHSEPWLWNRCEGNALAVSTHTTLVATRFINDCDAVERLSDYADYDRIGSSRF